MKTLKEIVGENLVELRKNRKITQFELAQELGYSDKSVSKWENGDNLPDLETLNELCKFYGVTLDYLTHPVDDNKANFVLHKDETKRNLVNHILIVVLVNLVVWFISTIIFVYPLINKIDGPFWLSFIYAVPLTCIISAIFSIYYFKGIRLLFFIFWSIFIWSILSATFLTALANNQNLWPIYLVGIPAQGALVTWFFIRR